MSPPNKWFQGIQLCRSIGQDELASLNPVQAWNSVGFLSCCETTQSQGLINGDNIFVLGPIQGCSKRVQLGKKEEPNLTAAVLFCFQPQLMTGTELLALAITSKFLISRVEIKVKVHRRKNE